MAAPAAPCGRTRATLVFWAAAFAIGLVLLAAERAVLLAVHGPAEGGLTMREAATVFLRGLRFDAAGLAIPMAAALVVSTLLRTIVRRGAERACAVAVLALTTLVAVAEVPWFGEFRSRLDAVALGFLEDPLTTGRLVHGSAGRAGLLALLAAFAVPVALSAWGLLVIRQRTLDRCGRGRPSPVAVLVLLAAFLVVARGGVVHPLGLHDADTGPRRLVRQLALSGLFSLERHAWAMWQDDVPPEAWRIEDAAARDVARRVFLRPGDKLMSDDAPSLRLDQRTDTAALDGWNVVLVLAGSSAARQIGALGASPAESLTPEFDRLAANGVLFTHFLANGPSTDRAVPAVFAGFPCLPRRLALTRSAEGQQDFLSLAHLLGERGWATAFVAGGTASSAELSAWLRNQGFQRTVERSDFRDEDCASVWGAHDRLVLDRTLSLCDEMAPNGPFLASVLTSSNQPPYSVPDDAEPARGGSSVDPRRERAMRYADRELGRFLDAAAQRPWGARTLFVVVGDHGFDVAPQADIDLDRHHVPLLLLTADGRLTARRDDRLASHVDLLPTLMRLVHTGPFVHAAWGRDLTAPDQADTRFVVLGPRGGEPVYAVVTDAGEVLVDRLDGGAPALFHVDFETHVLAPITNADAEIERLRRIGRGYLRAAHRTLLRRKAGG